MNSLEIIKKEFEDLQMNPLCSIGVVVGLLEPNNYYKWRSTFIGAVDSPYKFGLFILKLIFPEDYPNTRPQIYFLTPIYHLNLLNLNLLQYKKNSRNLHIDLLPNCKFFL